MAFKTATFNGYSGQNGFGVYNGGNVGGAYFYGSWFNTPPGGGLQDFSGYTKFYINPSSPYNWISNQPIIIGSPTSSSHRFVVSSSNGTVSLVVSEQGDTIFSGDTKISGQTFSSLPPGSITFGGKTAIYSPNDAEIVIGADRLATYNYTHGWKFTDYQITNQWGNPIEVQNPIGTIGNLWIGSNYTFAGYNPFSPTQQSTLFVKGTTASIMKVVGTGATWSNSASIFEILDSGNVGIGLTGPSTKLHIYATQSGAFRLQDGTQANGYILTSDTNGVGTWTASKSTSYNTYFVDPIVGSNSTGVYENASKPFQTIDYILSLPSYTGGVIMLLGDTNVFPLNGVIPRYHLKITSSQYVTLDLSANPNSSLVSGIGGIGIVVVGLEIDLPYGKIYQERLGAVGSCFTDANTEYLRMQVNVDTIYNNTTTSLFSPYYGINLRVRKVYGRNRVVKNLRNDIQLEEFVCLSNYDSCLVEVNGVQDFTVSINTISGAGSYDFGGVMNIGDISTTNVSGMYGNSGESGVPNYINFINSTITTTNGIELGSYYGGNTVFTGVIKSSPKITMFGNDTQIGKAKFLNFSTNLGLGTIQIYGADLTVENTNIKSTNSPFTFLTGNGSGSLTLKNSTFEMTNSVPLITGGAGDTRQVYIQDISHNGTVISDQEGTGVTVTVLGRIPVANAIDGRDAINKSQLDTLRTLFYNLGGTVSATNSTTTIYRTGSLNIGTGTTSNSRFVVSSIAGTTSLVVTEDGSVYNRGGGNNDSNTAFGNGALVSNTPDGGGPLGSNGTYNVALGTGAMGVNTTGYSNLAIGAYALYYNNGTYNVAIGGSALQSNTTGSQNMAIGGYSLLYNTTGIKNTAVGTSALQNSRGDYNTAIGNFSGYSITYASSNTLIGFQAGTGITTGSNNTIIADTGYGGTGGGITTGNNNLIIAQNHGNTTGITTGSNNTIIGKVTGLATGLSASVIISDGSGNIRFYSDINGNSGIGTSSPSTKLHVYANQSGAFRLQDGTQANGYILTSDTNGVGTWTASKSTSYNTYFVDPIVGSNSTGVYENASKPFQTIDYILSLPSYTGGVIMLLGDTNVFPLNGVIPRYHLKITSSQYVTLDLSANPNSSLVSGIGGIGIVVVGLEIDLPYGKIYQERLGAVGSCFTDANTEYLRMQVNVDTIYNNTTTSLFSPYYGINLRVRKVYGRNRVVKNLRNDIQLEEFVCLSNYDSCLVEVNGVQDFTVSINTISGAGSYDFGGVMNIGDISTTNVSGMYGNSGESGVPNYINFINSTITTTNGIELGSYYGGNTVFTGVIKSSPKITMFGNDTQIGKAKFLNFSTNLGLGTIQIYGADLTVENTNIKSTNSPFTFLTGNGSGSLTLKNSTFEMTNSVPLITGGAGDTRQVYIQDISHNGTVISDQEGTGVTVTVLGRIPVANAIDGRDAINKSQLDTLRTLFYNLGGTVSATNSTTTIYRTGSLNIGTGTTSNSRFVVSSIAGTTSLVVTEDGSVYNRGGGNNDSNTAFGNGALVSNTPDGGGPLGSNGTYNVALGTGAMGVNTTGYSNLAIGAYALYYNNGTYNVAIGGSALQSNTTGSQNMAIGGYSLLYNTTGIKNTAVGTSALQNSRGDYNTAIGNFSGYSITYASSNTLIGFQAGTGITTGSNNTIIADTGYGGTGGGITTGNNNLIIAQNHGNTTGITTGSNNTIIGKVTGLATGLSASVIISDGSGNIRFYSDINGNSGIGTTSPSTKLHVYATQSGAFRLQDGTQANGYVLVSDSNGVGSWTASRPYKVYTALLSQNGASVPSGIEGSENIVKGVTYYIYQNLLNYDLTPYGAPNSDPGTYFVSNTSVTLTTSDDLILNYDQGAPTVKVLENTIGNVYFSYNETGQYDINSGGLFSTDKTTGNNAIFYDGGVDSLCAMFMSDFTISSITMYSTKNLGGSGTYYDSLFSNVFIEIRVYD